MFISPISTVKNQNNYYKTSNNIKFRGNIGASVPIFVEQSVRSVEFTGRKIVNKIFSFLYRKDINKVHNELSEVDSSSPKYAWKLNKFSHILGSDKEIEINIENNKLKKITNTKTPHIFIMNHDNQSQDPKMMAFFNALLCNEYIRNGKSETFPRPKIILNKDILDSSSKKNREILTMLGAVPIDASITAPDRRQNAKQFIPLIKGYINGKNNIFIFPEGKFSILKNEPLENRFQLGVAEMVAKIADKVPEVNVTPIGFAYNKKSKLGDSIYIGETIVFKKEGKNLTSTSANISSSFAQKEYKDFFQNDSEMIIMDKSNPVQGRDLPPYIAGILCENLRICTEEAKASLPRGKSTQTFIA